MRKVALSDPVGPTAGLLYELQVSNAGPSDAQNVVVTDTLDANVTFVSASAGCVLTERRRWSARPARWGRARRRSTWWRCRWRMWPSGTVLTNTVVATTHDERPEQRQQHGDALRRRCSS